MSLFDPPQDKTGVVTIVQALTASLNHGARRLVRAINQDRADIRDLVQLMSVLTTSRATTMLLEMGVRYVGPGPSSPSGLLTPCRDNHGRFGLTNGRDQQTTQPVCGWQGMTQLMSSVSELVLVERRVRLLARTVLSEAAERFQSSSLSSSCSCNALDELLPT